MYSVVNKATALALTLLAVSGISAPIHLLSQGMALGAQAEIYKDFLTLVHPLPKLAV